MDFKVRESVDNAIMTQAYQSIGFIHKDDLWSWETHCLCMEARKQERKRKIPFHGPPSENWMARGGMGALKKHRVH